MGTGLRRGDKNRCSPSVIAYAIRRILLIIPTLLAIMVVNFVIVQAAPGGPVEQMISKLKGGAVSATERVSGEGGEFKPQAGGNDVRYRGARGLEPALIKELEKQYGFDKPPLERFLLMMRNYLTFDFGNSFFRDRRVVDLIMDDPDHLPRLDTARYQESSP